MTSSFFGQPGRSRCSSSRRWASGPRHCRRRLPTREAARSSKDVGLTPTKVIVLVLTIVLALLAKSNTGVDTTLYAATPPLEALKLLIGHAASHRDGGPHIMLSDMKRAYFHALAKQEFYGELPVEDDGDQYGSVGRLRLALCSTRDAASIWQECLAQHLESCGSLVAEPILVSAIMLRRTSSA